MLLENARIGEIAFNPVDRVADGRAPRRTGSRRSCAFRLRTTPGTGVHTFPYGVVPYDLDISPDGTLLSASVSEVNGDQFVRVWEHREAAAAGDVKPLSEFRFGQSVPESFVFSRDGRYLYGSSYYTGVSNIFRYEVATGKVEAVSNAETGFFRPVPLADGRLRRARRTPATGSFPRSSIRSRSRTSARSSSSARESSTKYPGRQDMAGAAAERRRRREADHRQRARTCRCEHARLANAYPGAAGLQERGRRRLPRSTSRIRCSSRTSASPPRTRRRQRCRATSARHVDIDRPTTSAGAASSSWNRSDFYDLFGPTKRSRKGYAAKVGYDELLIYDEPRKLTLMLRRRVLRQDRHAAERAERRHAVHAPRSPAQVGLHYTDVRSSLGAVDDEKGIDVERRAARRTA